MNSIFLIDDQPIANFITRKLLEVEGYAENVYDFTNPVKALDEIVEKEGVLIFLDLNMPEMSGWEVLDFMLENNLTYKTIILTSSTSEVDREKAKEYPGVLEYMVKPLNKKKFEMISFHLQDYKSSKD